MYRHGKVLYINLDDIKAGRKLTGKNEIDEDGKKITLKDYFKIESKYVLLSILDGGN